MATDPTIEAAISIGRDHAAQILEFRRRALARRADALAAHPAPLELRIERVAPHPAAAAAATFVQTAGVLVAEGDSWFDYPFFDVLEELEDLHGYDVESVAHKGDPIETMAYAGGQLEEFARRLEKILRRGVTPKAILLSGGGNDVAGDAFGMLINHARSAIAGLNDDVVRGVIDQRVRMAYVTILSAVTAVCQDKLGQPVPILVHGYDYAVPDGRGFLGGWGPLPGPWLEPGYREKGFGQLQDRIALTRTLIDRFNAMLAQIPAVFPHVHYVDLRNTLSSGPDYRDWWDNEFHPTQQGFERIADTFAQVLSALP
jgi:lysophospholipase L1-like esterase